MKIEGENLVVHRTPNGGHVGGEGEGGKGGGKEEASLYQNLDFMSKRGSDGITTANVYMEDTDRYVHHNWIFGRLLHCQNLLKNLLDENTLCVILLLEIRKKILNLKSTFFY